MCSRSQASCSSRSKSSILRSLGRRSALRLPVAVERALNLDEPDDRAEQRQEEPKTGDAAHRTVLPVEILVHVAHLGRDEEERDRREQEVDDEPDHAADAVAGVALDLLLRLVRPNVGVDAESQYSPEDRQPDRAGIADGPALD